MNPTELSSRTLEVAYTAVKSQRMRGDMDDLWWIDEETHKRIVEAEAALRDALVYSKMINDFLGRGGPKPTLDEPE